MLEMSIITMIMMMTSTTVVAVAAAAAVVLVVVVVVVVVGMDGHTVQVKEGCEEQSTGNKHSCVIRLCC